MRRLLCAIALCGAFAGLVASPTVGQHLDGRHGGGRGAPRPGGRSVTPSFQRPIPHAAAPRFNPRPSFGRTGVVPSAPHVTSPNFTVPRANAGFNRPEFARPSVTQRPQFNRSNVIVPQRPTARIRPTIPPRLPTERPRVTKRPQFNRPNVANRPNINTFNRNFNTSNRNFNTFNRNRWDYSRDHGSYQRPWWNRPAYWNRSWYAGRPVWY